MKTTLKSGTLALAALAIFTAPALARIEETAVRTVIESGEPAKLLLLGDVDLVLEQTVPQTRALIRTAASRKAKRRLRASTTVRINKKRMRRKPAVRITRAKTLTQAPASAHAGKCKRACGEPVLDFPEDFAP